MNNIGLLLFIIVLPIVLILVFVTNKDREKEPIGLLLQLFFLGMISCILTLGVSYALEYFPFMSKGRENVDFISVFLYSFIGIAFVEEICKWIILYIRGYKSKYFDELYDVIVYSIFVSLGFAFLENMIFIFNEEVLDIYVIILRAICAIPGHACYAIFMGYYLSLAKKFSKGKNKKLSRNNLLLSIIVPILLHGIYDCCLLSEIRLLIYVFTVYMIVLYYISYKKLKLASKTNENVIKKIRICKKCGCQTEKDFCPYCGKKIIQKK